MYEIELKFEVPGPSLPSLAKALARGRLTEERLRASYFDTADELLARHRMAIRLRQEGSRWVQTLKASLPDSLHRLEHEVTVASGPRGQAPALDRSLHDGSPAGDALAQVLPADALLVARYNTDVRRTSRSVRVGASLVEIAFDVGWVTSGAAREHICEIEFELKRGPVDGLFDLASRWVREHGLWFNTKSKAERGTLLAQGLRHGPARKARPVDFASRATAKVALRNIASNAFEQISTNASEVAGGSDQDDHLHQVRVGLRRLRTALRELGPLDPAIDAGWEPVLQRAFRQLGEVRDRETIQSRIEEQLTQAGAAPQPAGDVPTPADAAAERQPLSPSQTLLDTDFQLTLLALLRYTVSPPTEADSPDVGAPGAKESDSTTLREHVEQRLKRLHRQVTRDGKRFASLSADEQHLVRKRLKRLRYLGEFTMPLFNKKRMRRYLAILSPAQDLLGDHQDRQMALQNYQPRAAHDVHAAFAAGWLSAKQEDSARACQRALEDLVDAPRFWRKRG